MGACMYRDIRRPRFWPLAVLRETLFVKYEALADIALLLMPQSQNRFH